MDDDDDISIEIVKDLLAVGDNDEDDGSNGRGRIEFEKVYVNDVMDEAARLELEEGRPSEWMIMKEVSTVQSHIGHLAVA
jgi:hypothetical protein